MRLNCSLLTDDFLIRKMDFDDAVCVIEDLAICSRVFFLRCLTRAKIMTNENQRWFQVASGVGGESRLRKR